MSVLERKISVVAETATVWAFLSDPQRFASWWPRGITVEVTSSVEHQISFLYGYESPERPIPVGGSKGQLSLVPVSLGTEIEVRHEFADAKVRDLHVPGWRYQLAVLANLVTADQHRHAEQRIDTWFAAWNETDAAKRAVLLGEATTEDVAFQDQHGFVESRSDVAEHIGAVHLHMPNMYAARDGAIQRTHATAVAAWLTKPKDSDQVPLRGTNVFDFAKDGRIRRVVGLWSA
jgi:hypothetical protein